MLGKRAAAGGPSDSGARRGAREDVELVGRIVRRDRHAFEDLYRAYQPRLSRFLLSILRRANLVEEVLNDTMLVVWANPDRYNGQSKVSTWIFAIAYRKALKALRRVDEPIEDREAEQRPSAEAGPEQMLSRSQVREVLVRAMGELSPDHRAVVDLTYFHEIGYREIAELMDCPVDTVKTRMFHARRHLRRKLAGELADWL